MTSALYDASAALYADLTASGIAPVYVGRAPRTAPQPTTTAYIILGPPAESENPDLGARITREQTVTDVLAEARVFGTYAEAARVSTAVADRWGAWPGTLPAALETQGFRLLSTTRPANTALPSPPDAGESPVWGRRVSVRLTLQPLPVEA